MDGPMEMRDAENREGDWERPGQRQTTTTRMPAAAGMHGDRDRQIECTLSSRWWTVDCCAPRGHGPSPRPLPDRRFRQSLGAKPATAYNPYYSGTVLTMQMQFRARGIFGKIIYYSHYLAPHYYQVWMVKWQKRVKDGQEDDKRAPYSRCTL